MLKRTVLVACTLMSFSAFASEEMSCKIEVAVATPPVQKDQNVAFNATTDNGFSKSITLKGGSGPQFIERVPCTSIPITLTATLYGTPSNGNAFMAPDIGKCILKAGSIYLNGPDNSVSVVFPYDFNC